MQTQQMQSQQMHTYCRRMRHRILVSHCIMIERHRMSDVQALGAAAGESDLSDRRRGSVRNQVYEDQFEISCGPGVDGVVGMS